MTYPHRIRPRGPWLGTPAEQTPRRITVPCRLADWELADTPELWWPRVRRAGGRRWYEPLLEDASFEAWLLGWPVGEGIDLHDHGSSSGAL